jgi:hypothetical protein
VPIKVPSATGKTGACAAQGQWVTGHPLLFRRGEWQDASESNVGPWIDDLVRSRPLNSFRSSYSPLQDEERRDSDDLQKTGRKCQQPRIRQFCPITTGRIPICTWPDRSKTYRLIAALQMCFHELMQKQEDQGERYTICMIFQLPR